MFDKELIQQLKQVNISIDTEKTKARTYELWKNASKSERESIEALAGVARATVQRAYKTGSLSAKLAVPFAQVLDVDPLYLIGETDEQGSCTEDGLRELLMAKGYEKLLTGKAKRSYKRKDAAPVAENKRVESAEEMDGPADVKVSDFTPAPADDAKYATLQEDDMLLLMRSIVLRAKSGIPSACKQLNDLYKLLLS